MVLNARSLYNKAKNFKSLLHQILPDLVFISEMWERENKRLSEIIQTNQYKYFSYLRKKVKSSQPGGGCAIYFNDDWFDIQHLDINVPEGIEICWALVKPKHYHPIHQKVRWICSASVYISPRSNLKKETIEHIISTIHYIRSRYDQIFFIITGDFNRTDPTDILDSYGALKQICTVKTRNDSTLEIILTDLHTLYFPPTAMDPLQVDLHKCGVDSDHNTVVLAPLSNQEYKLDRIKKTIVTRPLPESRIPIFASG